MNRLTAPVAAMLSFVLGCGNSSSDRRGDGAAAGVASGTSGSGTGGTSVGSPTAGAADGMRPAGSGGNGVGGAAGNLPSLDPGPAAAGVSGSLPTSSSADFTTYLANPARTNFVDDGTLVPPLRRLWTVPLGQSITYPLVAGDFVYVTTIATETASARILAFDDVTGAPAWSADLGAAASGNLAYDGGRVFEVDSSSATSVPMLRAFNASNGSLEWQARADSPQLFHGSAPVAYNGTLYTIASGGSSGPMLYAYDESSGAVQWTGASANGMPAVSADGIFAFDTCGNTSAFNLGGGSKWQQGTGTCYPAGSSVLLDHTLYVTSGRVSNARLDTRTGMTLGTFSSDRFPPTFGHAMELDTIGNTLQAVPIGSSAPAWTFTPEGELVTPGLIVGDAVYVASSVGTVYALGATTGKVVWSENIGTGFSSLTVGMAAGHGLLVLPAATDLVAYGPAGAAFAPDVHQYGGQKACPWTLVHAPSGPGAASPNAMVVADFNKDGKRDIALGSVGPFGGGGVNVSLGLGDGSFNTLQETWGFGDGTSLIAAADVDGDGVLDIAAASNAEASDGNPNLKVLIGKGDGTFKSPASYSTGGAPSGLALEDLNGDGRPDIVLANQGAVVLLNQGKGTFAAPVAYGDQWTSSLALGDFNGDHKPDLVLGTNDPSAALVFLGKGDGTFGASQPTSVGGWPSAFAVGDLDGDGKLDLVVAAGDVEIFAGKGDGSFAPAVTFPAGDSVSGVVLGDVDLDGIADLIVTNSASHSIRIFFAKGDGTFQGREAFATGSIPILPTIADFNGDGRPDIATCDTLSNSVSLFLGACSTAGL